MKKLKITPVLYIDIDNTVRRSATGQKFIKNAFDQELLPGIEEKLHEYKDQNYVIFGVSNQGGIAYGFKTKEDVNYEFSVMRRLFKDDPFEDIIWCPFMIGGKVEEYNQFSMFRKPNIGMLCQIENYLLNFNVIPDYSKSLMVGDMMEDQAFAKNANIKFEWIDDFLKGTDDGGTDR